MRPIGFMPPGRFCVYMEPRANLDRSSAPVPLTAASVSATRQYPTPKRRYTMKEINLRDFYPWYMEDVMVEVTEKVAEELLAGQRYIKASRRRIYRNKAHYRNPFSLQGRDMLLALFFLLYALICILILLLRTSRHRTSVQFTCVFNTQNTTFSGFIFVSRKLLYFEAQESVVLRFQPVCIAVRSIPHKLL